MTKDNRTIYQILNEDIDVTDPSEFLLESPSYNDPEFDANQAAGRVRQLEFDVRPDDPDVLADK